MGHIVKDSKTILSMTNDRPLQKYNHWQISISCQCELIFHIQMHTKSLCHARAIIVKIHNNMITGAVAKNCFDWLIAFAKMCTGNQSNSSVFSTYVSISDKL